MEITMYLSKFKLITVASTAIFLTACSSPGPMQLPSGPVNTSVFEPVALDLAKDWQGEILFKSSNSLLYRGDERYSSFFTSGTFFITQSGAYYVIWDSNNYKYSMMYEIKAEDIKGVAIRIEERNYLPDLRFLDITNIGGETTSFTMYNHIGAEQTLAKLISSK